MDLDDVANSGGGRDGEHDTDPLGKANGGGQLESRGCNAKWYPECLCASSDPAGAGQCSN